ncbi:uncharacterized protein [Macrobrachium rosenbergii]|uniref:uncharacterized protein isoform X2 n=1 Tax=Macrobrachium rosenbergii TaxID=79674 RepID=UPI0034D5E46F
MLFTHPLILSGEFLRVTRIGIKLHICTCLVKPEATFLNFGPYEMESVDTCQLCYEVYDEETRRPRILPCGHSYCTDCISKLIMNGRLTCPECNTNVVASDSSQIPVNYGMERCISVMKEKKFCTICKLQPPNKIRTMQDMIDSQKSSALNLLLSSEALESQLSNYQQFLENSIEKHKELAIKLHEKAVWHESIVKKMTEEQEKTKGSQEQVILYSENMRANLPELDCADSNKAISIAVAKVTETFGDLTNCLSKCQAELPHPSIALSQKGLMKSVAVLHEEDSHKYEEDFCASILSSSHLTILEKLTLCSKGKISFTVEQLKSDPDTWKKIIKSGRVFAVSSVNGRDRFAALSMKDGQVYLHCLQDQEVPPFSYQIEHSEIVSCSGKASTAAFFDLELDCSTKGRFHILMPSNTPLAQHFRAVCTGELGPTYINKKFVSARDTFDRAISCESYFDNSTIGSLNHLGRINLSDDLYRCVPETGAIWMNKDGTFHIITGSVDGSRYARVFGKVKDEISMLREVATQILNGFKDIKIVESGVVLQI